MMGTINKRNVWKRAGVVLALCWPVCATVAATAASSYKFVDLGPVGNAGSPNHVTNNDISVGTVQGSDGNDHAVVYFDQHLIDISNPGLGGANSLAQGNNSWGEVVGGANIANIDPKKEDFCGFQSLGIATATASCRPILWWDGQMTALPTLDHNHGNNGFAASINDFGEIAGAAENTTPGCLTQNPAAGLYQYYEYKPVLWRDHTVEQLGTVGGDPVGAAVAINDHGEAVGTTGTCGAYNLLLGYFMNPLHAVLWEKNGRPIDLKSLGGNENSALGNAAKDINCFGHVTGYSSLSDNATIHAFLWTRKEGKMQDLKPLSGIANSAAIALNDKDDVVGASISADFSSLTATIWKHGVPANLNNYVPAGSTLTLLFGCSINSRGEILGLAYDVKAMAYHAYELIPAGE
jgi:probable HAF family extracellular repeat protein